MNAEIPLVINKCFEYYQPSHLSSRRCFLFESSNNGICMAPTGEAGEAALHSIVADRHPPFSGRRNGILDLDSFSRIYCSKE